MRRVVEGAIALVLAVVPWLFPNWELSWKVAVSMSCAALMLGAVVVRQSRALAKLPRSSREAIGERSDEASHEYGMVEATSREEDNATITQLLKSAKSSVDMLFLTGKNTFDNQSNHIAEAIARGVTVRVLLFDETSEHLGALAVLLDKKGPEINTFLEGSLATLKRLQSGGTPNAGSRLKLKRFTNLLAFDLLIVDSSIVWYHPMMPTFEQCYPSFVLRPSRSSGYLVKVLDLYDGLFNLSTESPM